MVRFDWKLPAMPTTATGCVNLIPRLLFASRSTSLSTRQRSEFVPVTEQWKVVTDPWLALKARGVRKALRFREYPPCAHSTAAKINLRERYILLRCHLQLSRQLLRMSKMFSLLSSSLIPRPHPLTPGGARGVGTRLAFLAHERLDENGRALLRKWVSCGSGSLAEVGLACETTFPPGVIRMNLRINWQLSACNS